MSHELSPRLLSPQQTRLASQVIIRAPDSMHDSLNRVTASVLAMRRRGSGSDTCGVQPCSAEEDSHRHPQADVWDVDGTGMQTVPDFKLSKKIRKVRAH